MGLSMRIGLLVGAAAAALSLGSAAAATVAPPTRESRIISAKRELLETRARQAFGDPALIEKLRDWRKHWGFILVGAERSSAPPRLLIKDEHGWYEMRPGQTRRLPPELGLELTRLLSRPELWSEQPYNFTSRCSSNPRLFVVAHAGQDSFGRLGCGPEGIAARAARTAELLRALPGEARTTAKAPQERRRPLGASPAYFAASEQISRHIFDMAAAWERKTLAGFVDPYAEDAVVERPEAVLRGRKAIINWARHLQNWDAPYVDGDRRLTVHQIVSNAQPADGIFYTTHEIRWEEEGKPLRQTYSTLWRNHGGLWRIAHERISEIKPVADRMPIR